MKRLIPGKTKVQVELFKGVMLGDIFVAGLGIAMLVLILISSLPYKLYFCIAVMGVAGILLVRLDTVPNYRYLLQIITHYAYKRRYERITDDELLKSRALGTEKATKFDRLFKNKGDAEQEPVTLKPAKQEKQAAKASRQADLQKRGKRSDKKRAKQTQPSGDRARAAKKAREEEDRLLRSDSVSEEEKDAIRARRREEFAASMQRQALSREAEINREDMSKLIGFTGIQDAYIEYNGEYFGGVIEIDPVEFRFFSEHRRANTIENCFGRVLRSIHGKFSANIIKLERAINYDSYLARERAKLDALRQSFESGLLTEEEYQIRVEITWDRVQELEAMCGEDKVIDPFYYLALFESDKKQLDMMLRDAVIQLEQGELTVRRLQGRELAVFLKYTNQLDFDEHEVDQIRPEDYALWAQPNVVDVYPRRVEVNHIVTHNFRVVSYPMTVGDAWLAGVMSIPGTKVVVKARQMDRDKAVRTIDRSLMELRGQWSATGIDSKRLEIEAHLNTLQELLATLQGDNEMLFECNVYITAYDIMGTRNNLRIPQPPKSRLPSISSMKKSVRRSWQEAGFRLNNMEFDQMRAFLGSQVSSLDPLAKEGRGIPSNTVAASFPWIYAHISDEGGVHLGQSGGVPVFINFFRRDSERINSNMVIIGKSGSGKSYATKSLLANLAAEDAKIFILDPENEYTELARNLHGKYINVGNATYGRLNPFHIITALDDDEAGTEGPSGSYATHLQFLEEFFRQILPDCDKDALEYLNNMVDRVYTDKGITPETDLSKLRPQDYPVFDDLYETIFEEFQSTDNQYLRTILRTLMNYIAKFSRDGRNANIWNGPSTVTTDENFTVFNFQSLLANRNTTIANAQMLLVLKYIDNEIIKNRDFNTRYGLKRKIVVVIDEAHVFIDTKFPVALDFMFQLAKRIRKYNGMQIVITQNIKDFVGSEEIARKSTAIINACQYSFIFALAPNDIQDLVRLYQNAGGINESEQEQIIQAPRGQAFTILSPSSRSTFQVETNRDITEMFEQPDYQSKYYASEQGALAWEDYVADSRSIRAERMADHVQDELPDEDEPREHRGFVLEEVSEEDYDAEENEGFSFEEELPPEESGERKPTLPPDAPAYRADAGSDALVSGIRDLVESVRGLSMDAVRSEVRRSIEAQLGNSPGEGDSQTRYLYETIEALRRQNAELQRKLDAGEAAGSSGALTERSFTPTGREADPFAPEGAVNARFGGESEAMEDGSDWAGEAAGELLTPADPWSTIFGEDAAAAEADSDRSEEFAEASPASADPWSTIFGEDAAAAEADSDRSGEFAADSPAPESPWRAVFSEEAAAQKDSSDPWSNVWDSIAAEPEEAEAPESLSDPWSSVWDTGAPEPEQSAAGRLDDEEEIAASAGPSGASAETASGQPDRPAQAAAPQPAAEANTILDQFNDMVSRMSVLQRMNVEGLTVLEISLDELKAQIEAERVRRPVSS